MKFTSKTLKTKTLKATTLALAALGLSACGGGGGSGGGSANPSCVEELNLFTDTGRHEKISSQENTYHQDGLQAPNEVIIGDLRWQSTHTLKDAMQRSNANATVYLSIPARSSRCTGFLINDNTIMTNNHCVGKTSDARGVKATFQWTSQGKGKTYTCDKFVGTNRGLDFGLIQCKGSPGKDYPKVVLADYPGQTKDGLYITHQNCNYKSSPSCKPTQKFSAGTLLKSGSSQVEHNADTLPGSSGSPIFDAESHKVIAIHNAGRNYGPNNGGMNYGIPMYRIVDYIRDNYREVQMKTSDNRQPAYQACGE